MTRPGPGAAVAIALAALLLWGTAARASTRPTLPRGPELEPELEPPPIEPPEPILYPIPEIDLWEPDMAQPDRLSAFLYMIRTAEHGERSDDAARYSTFYGGGRFQGMADHPVITGERKGVPLPERYCRAAGLRPGCVSTAAGAYQIIRPTWDAVRVAGRWGPRLPDFGVDSQDEAARRILARAGALSRLEAGDVEGAIRAAATQWASLPGSSSGQPQRTMAQALAYYQAGIEAQG